MPTPRHFILCFLAVGLLVLASCASGRTPVAEVITVEGSVAVRGNEPFSAYVLQTAADTFYVLRFPETEPPETPARLRVTGRLYRAEWEGRPFAHLDVQEFEEIR